MKRVLKKSVNVAINAHDTTLYSKCNQTSDLLCQLECASEVESGLGETLDWVLKWLVNLIAGKTQLVSFYQSNSSCATDVKIDGSVLLKTCLFCDSNCLFLLSCTRAFRLSLLLQPPSRNLEP